MNQKLRQIKNQETLSDEAQQQCNDLMQLQKMAQEHVTASNKLFEPLLLKGDSKMELYEFEKRINDYDYTFNSEQTKMKKKYEQELMQLKQRQEEKFQDRFTEIEDKRNDQY